MTFKYQLRLVAFTWPNLCLWAIILCPELKPKNLKNSKKKPRFYQPWSVRFGTDTRNKLDCVFVHGYPHKKRRRFKFG